MHGRILILGIVLMLMFLFYAYGIDHKHHIRKNSKIYNIMVDMGLKDQIKNITHDGDTWYYKGHTTGIGFGRNNEPCEKSEVLCAGDNNNIIHQTFGTLEQQIKLVKECIDSETTPHNRSPLIYGY